LCGAAISMNPPTPAPPAPAGGGGVGADPPQPPEATGAKRKSYISKIVDFAA